MELGLEEYWDNFEQSGYTEPRMLEDLKMMNKETLMNDFNITKPAHLDKLYKAIQKVQYPSECKFKTSLRKHQVGLAFVVRSDTKSPIPTPPYSFSPLRLY